MMTIDLPKQRQQKNEMMDHPVVLPEIVAFMRSQLKPFSGFLGQLADEARRNRVPIIPHETAVFLDLLLGQMQPKHILEIGTAVGYSALLMAQHVGEHGQLTTIDRYPHMLEQAQRNIAQTNIHNRIQLIAGDAADELPKLSGPFDVIFMDSAKSKYYAFFPECMRLLRRHGVLIVDDVLQGGSVLQDESTIPKRIRKIHRELKRFLAAVMNHPQLKTSLLPLGDGLLLIEKLSDEVSWPTNNETSASS